MTTHVRTLCVCVWTDGSGDDDAEANPLEVLQRFSEFLGTGCGCYDDNDIGDIDDDCLEYLDDELGLPVSDAVNGLGDVCELYADLDLSVLDEGACGVAEVCEQLTTLLVVTALARPRVVWHACAYVCVNRPTLGIAWSPSSLETTCVMNTVSESPITTPRSGMCQATRVCVRQDLTFYPPPCVSTCAQSLRRSRSSRR